MNDSIKNKADQVIGSIKENIGKAVESEELELKGKLQKTAGEVMEKTEEIGKNVKEKLAEKANDLIDNLKNEKKD